MNAQEQLDVLEKVLTPEELQNFKFNVDACEMQIFNLCDIASTSTASEMLMAAFNWQETDQGFRYWDAIDDRLIMQEEDPCNG